MVYLDSLAHEYGSATQYYADAHPSIGNYFMMIVGDTITDNDGYSSIVTKDNIAAARGRRHESTLRLSAEVLGLTTFPPITPPVHRISPSSSSPEAPSGGFALAGNERHVREPHHDRTGPCAPTSLRSLLPLRSSPPPPC